MKKEVSICHSLMCLDLVSFPVLSRRLHSWRWPSVNRFSFLACDHASPRTQNFDFSRLTETQCQKLHQSSKKNMLALPNTVVCMMLALPNTVVCMTMGDTEHKDTTQQRP